MNILKRFWVLGGAGLLVVAGAAMPGKIIDDFQDPIQYETPVAEYYHEAKAAEEGDAEVNVKKVIIHYYNTDKKNADREIYTWTTGNDSKHSDLVKDSDDTTGNYWHIELDYTGADSAYAGKTFLNFIVKPAKDDDWTGQSLDILLDFTQFPPNSSGVVEVWCVSARAGKVDIYASKDDTKMSKLSEAYFTNWKTIHCVGESIDGKNRITKKRKENKCKKSKY